MNATRRKKGARPVRPCFGDYISSASGQDSFSTGGTDTIADNQTSYDSTTEYEAGSYAHGSFALSSVSCSESDNGTFSMQDNDNLTENGTGSDDESDSGTGSDTTAFGVGTFGDQGSFSDSETVTDSFLDTSTDFTGDQGGDSFTTAELGSYANGSFAFSSVVYQSADSSTESTQESSTDSTSGTAHDSSTDQDTGSSGECLADSGAASGDCFDDTDNECLALGDNDFMTDTGNDSDQATFFEGGSYANGSFAFSTVSSTETDGGSSSEQGTDTTTDHGTVSATDTESDDDSEQQADVDASADAGTVSETDLINGSISVGKRLRAYGVRRGRRNAAN